ncbi:MAG TPA: cytochrome c oxidase subunit II transmembrane domain-containing protein [Steroidobacter sp.]|jgi:cytochrome c oxidase subunit 2|nr:cytochrome c oxidase subunit II transmembrane domain-containing protein [Steroidobacter sp.]
MHITAVWICGAVTGVIFGLMLYSIATFRTSSNTVAAKPHRNAAVEVLWALIPILILLGAAAPAVRTMISSSAPLASLHGVIE